jgi:hypothetical protein
MAQALNHAESTEPGWGNLVYQEFLWWCLGESGTKFTAPEFIDYCLKDARVPAPPTNKAFGSCFTRAAKAGLIRKVGYQPHPLRHASPTVLWEVV